MDSFEYQNGKLFCEQTPVQAITSEVGTPAYIYSRRTFEQHYRAIERAFAPLDPVICFAIKSCSNIHICKLLADMGSGMDIVSGGELFRAKRAGADMSKVVYAGAGKTDEEITSAINAGIGYFNIESEAEFENISSIARNLGKTASAALRINPDVDPKSAHAKTTTGKKESKFGVDIDRARRFFASYGKDENLQLKAIHLHIGSPVYTVEPYVNAVKKALALIDELKEQGFNVTTLDIGGGFGADYQTGQTPAYQDYADAIVPLLVPFKQAGGAVILEPGRTVSANAGILVAKVNYIKQGGNKKFVIIDSGMHHLIRPTLYDSFHFIWPVETDQVPQQRSIDAAGEDAQVYDVVGPICETGDYLALGRKLPQVTRGDLLAVFGAGAYGMAMSSNYNTMVRPVEVLVDGENWKTIRRRETYEDLIAPEVDL